MAASPCRSKGNVAASSCRNLPVYLPVFSGELSGFFLIVERAHVVKGLVHGSDQRGAFSAVVFLPVLPEVPAAQVEHELSPAADDVWRHHVFELAGYGVGFGFLNLQHLKEKLPENDVPVGNVAPDAAARFREMNEAVGLVVHKAQRLEHLEHGGHGGTAHPGGVGYGAHARRALAGFFQKDDLKIVFQRGRKRFVFRRRGRRTVELFRHGSSVFSGSLTFPQAVFKPFLSVKDAQRPEKGRRLRGRSGGVHAARAQMKA